MDNGTSNYIRYLIDMRQRGGKVALLLALIIVAAPFIVFTVGSGWLVSPLFKSVGFDRDVGFKSDGKEDSVTVALDWSIPNGHFYTQASGQELGESQKGFKVTDDDGIMFMRDYDWLGGVDVVGFPASRRFVWRGIPSQVFTKAVLQWNSQEQQSNVVNIMDVLSEAGKDDWLLQTYSVPKPFPSNFDEGKSWNKIVEDRQTVMTKNTSFLNRYFSVSDPMRIYGLPTSYIEDMGNHYALRTQRTVIQQWKQDTPWAGAFQLTTANAGAIAIEAGIFPPEVEEPEDPPSGPSQ